MLLHDVGGILNDCKQRFVDCGRIVASIDAGYFYGFHKKNLPGSLAPPSRTTVLVDVSVEIFVEVEQIRQDQ